MDRENFCLLMRALTHSVAAKRRKQGPCPFVLPLFYEKVCTEVGP